MATLSHVRLLRKNHLLQRVTSQVASLNLYKEDHYRFTFNAFFRQHLRFNITKCRCTDDSSQLYIYDGPGTDILIEQIRACDRVPMLGITTQYFVSLVEYDAGIDVGSHYIEIYFKEHFDEVIELNAPTDGISVQHNYTQNAILKKVFRISTVPNANYYPRITMNIEELHGYTDNICSDGGIFVFTDGTYFENISHKSSGFVCDMDDSGYFVGKHNSLTLSHDQYFLIFYAYSDKFNLQLSFVITKDDCRGFLNMCSLCYRLLTCTEGVPDNKLAFKEALITCHVERDPVSGETGVYVSVSPYANSCLKFQSMVLIDTLHCSYLTLYPYTVGHLTVGISFVAAKPLRSAQKQSCGVPYLKSLATHMRRHPGNRLFTTQDEDIEFIANEVMVTHNRTCKHTSFSYYVTLRASPSSVVCVVNRNLNLKLYSICGHLITNYHIPVVNRIFIR